MSLELSPEVEKVVRARAEREEVSVDDLLARTFLSPKEKTPLTSDPKERVLSLLAKWQAEDHTPLMLPISTQNGETPTQALFRKWAEEDAKMTEEEKEAEDRLWEDLEKGLHENSSVLRLRRLAP